MQNSWNPKITFIAITLSSMFLTQCTRTQPKIVQSTLPNKKSISLIFSSNKHLALKPCGCSLQPMGGLAREANLLGTQFSKKGVLTVPLSAGTTFIEHSSEIVLSHAERLKRAQFLVKTWNKIGMGVLSPSIEDTELGIESLQLLQKTARFPFVSANIYHQGKPLFPQAVDFHVGQNRVRVIGLSPNPTNGKRIPSSVSVTSYRKSLKPLLTNLSNTLVILLAPNLKQKEITRILEEFPRLNIVVKSIEPQKDPRSYQLGAYTLKVETKARGQGLTQVKLQNKGLTFGRFYNETTSHYLKYDRERWKKGLRLSSKEASGRYLKLLNQTKEIPLEPNKNVTVYEFEHFLMSRKYNPKDPTIEQQIKKLIHSKRNKDTK